MKRLLAILITLTLIFGIMPQISLAADITSSQFTEYMADAALTYEFTNETRAIADGTITLNVPESAQAVVTGYTLYWGSDAQTPLATHTALKAMKDEANRSDDATDDYVFVENPIYTYTLDGNRGIPKGATYVLAVVEYTASDVSGEYTVSCEIPSTKVCDDTYEELLYTYYAHSDVHAGTGDVIGSQFFKNFEYLQEYSKTLGDKFTGMVVNGDIANQSFDYEFSNFEDAIANAKVDFPVYIVQGNHDFDAEWVKEFKFRTKELKEKYNITYVSNTEYGFDFYMGGHHYIGLTVGDKYNINTEWLERKIMESEKSGVPTFVLNHVPVTGTLRASENGYPNACTNSDAIKAVYDRHPTVIQYSGHVHSALETDDHTVLVNDDTASYIETSAWMENLRYISSTGKRVSTGEQCGRLIEVYADKVVVKGMNLKQEKLIGRGEYVIPYNQAKFDGTVSVDYDDLSVGSEVSVKLNGQAVDTDKYSISWKIAGEEIATDVTSYTVVTENQNVCVTVTDKETGAYASAATSYEDAPLDLDGDSDGEDTSGSIVIDNTIGIKNNGSIVLVKGNVGASYAGKTLKLLLVDRSDITDPENIAYFGECTVAADGSYTHKFKFYRGLSGYVLLAKCGDNDVTKSISTVKSALEENITMDVELDSENKAVISIVNSYADSVNDAKVIIAAYDTDEKLIYTKIEDVDVLFGEDGNVQVFNSANANTGAYIRVFLWNSIGDIIPLTKVDRVDVPELSTTIQ